MTLPSPRKVGKALPPGSSDGWTPIRRGPYYCSPSCCGLTSPHRCTWAAYVEAKRASQAACAWLGNGWTPRVYENLGWHWSAVAPGIEVFPSLGNLPESRYHAIIGGNYTAHGATPIEAAYNAAKRMAEAVRGLKAVIDSLPTPVHGYVEVLSAPALPVPSLPRKAGARRAR